MRRICGVVVAIVLAACGGGSSSPPVADARSDDPDAQAPIVDGSILIDARATSDGAPSPADAGGPDAQPVPPDAAPVDAGSPDAAPPDAAPPDAAPPDAGCVPDPSGEICQNGVDDDCDDAIDEGFGPGVPCRLAVTISPARGLAGRPLAPSLTVEIHDDGGAIVPTASDTITVALGVNPTMAILGGTTSVAATAGTATFDTLIVDR